jgi:hypothetical protein
VRHLCLSDAVRKKDKYFSSFHNDTDGQAAICRSNSLFLLDFVINSSSGPHVPQRSRCC